MSAKIRLDQYLAQQGLAPSRQKAQALVLAGCVYVNEVKADSVALTVKPEDRVEVRGRDHPYVSRGGVKLAHALDTYHVDVRGRVAVDIGASTGGFTDCLLQQGVKKVYAVDVGYGQLDWRLRQDERVVCIERCNARYWSGEEIDDKIDIVTIDVSFISLTLIIEAIDKILAQKGGGRVTLIGLIKPQFEAERSDVGSGGVVREPDVHERVIQKVRDFLSASGWSIIGVTESPIQGAKGNREYVILAERAFV